MGQVARQGSKNVFEFRLRSPAIVEKGQKVAISKREQNGWRLRAYGVAQ